MNPILFWTGIVILYLIIGCQIAKASLEVYDKWGQEEDETFSTWIGLRLILFPLNSINEVWNRDPWWPLVNSVRTNHSEELYIGINVFFWPVRIVWFGFTIAMTCAIIPPLSLVLFVF